jgi:probable rRNA maturation factor
MPSKIPLKTYNLFRRERGQITIINRQSFYRIDKPFFIRLARLTLEEFELCLGHALNIVFVDNLEISKLNKRFLGIGGATDVLSFQWKEKIDGVNLLGEIVISVEKAIAEAKNRGSPIKKELVLYLVHGILHLVGYNDETKQDKIEMRMEEERILMKMYFRRLCR